MKSQVLMILEHMQTYGSITSMEAIKYYSVTRLSSVIHILRHKHGYNVMSKWESCINKFGRPVAYCRYYIKGETDE